MTATGNGHISRYGRTFYVLCVAVVAWQCFVMALDTLHGGVGQMLHEGRMAVVAAANALLLLAPYWLLPRRWRWAVWIPSALLTLWCLMQMCYCRAYDDLMPWQSLTLTDNVNSTLASSTVALMRWQDLGGAAAGRSGLYGRRHQLPQAPPAQLQQQGVLCPQRSDSLWPVYPARGDEQPQRDRF